MNKKYRGDWIAIMVIWLIAISLVYLVVRKIGLLL
jgi:hypothetical protein